MSQITEIFNHTTTSGSEGSLGIDEQGRLYWNGKAVVTEQRLALGWWVNVSIIVGGFSALISAISSILIYFSGGSPS